MGVGRQLSDPLLVRHNILIQLPGTNWRVYTFFEGGGYPYRCEFSVVAL
jgi:hypothetical protein